MSMSKKHDEQLAEVEGLVAMSEREALAKAKEELAAERDRANVYARGWREMDAILQADETESLQTAAERVIRQRDEARQAFRKLHDEIGDVVRDVRERSSESIARRFFNVLVNNRLPDD
jgi:hypothetical protein